MLVADELLEDIGRLSKLSTPFGNYCNKGKEQWTVTQQVQQAKQLDGSSENLK